MRVGHCIIGSGTLPYSSQIRPGVVVPGKGEANGWRDGMHVIVVNPEEFAASPFFGTSGAVVMDGDTLELTANVSLRRTIQISNFGPGFAILGPDSGVLANDNGWILPPVERGAIAGTNSEITLPLMPNAKVYVLASGHTDLRWLEY